MDELTKDLAVELAPFGVTVENQAPFYVATKMSKIRRPRLDAPSPKAWVAAGIRQIGCAARSCLLESVHRCPHCCVSGCCATGLWVEMAVICLRLREVRCSVSGLLPPCAAFVVSV